MAWTLPPSTSPRHLGPCRASCPGLGWSPGGLPVPSTPWGPRCPLEGQQHESLGLAGQRIHPASLAPYGEAARLMCHPRARPGPAAGAGPQNGGGVVAVRRGSWLAPSLPPSCAVSAVARDGGARRRGQGRAVRLSRPRRPLPGRTGAGAAFTPRSMAPPRRREPLAPSKGQPLPQPPPWHHPAASLHPHPRPLGAGGLVVGSAQGCPETQRLQPPGLASP